MNPRLHSLERLLRLLTFTTLAASVLAYPLMIDPSLRNYFDATFPRERFPTLRVWHELHVIDYFMTMGYPLQLKETAAAMFLLLLAAGWFWWRVLLAMRGAKSPRTDRPFWASLHLPLALLALWMTASLWWTPTPHYALETFGMAALGLLFFLIVHEVFACAPAAERTALTRKWSNAFLLLMVPVAAISFLEHVWPNGVFRIFPLVGYRNRIASVIGHNTGLSAFCLFTCYFTVTRLFDPRVSRPQWVAMALYTLLLGFLIVSAQSRAVWLLGAVGLPVVVYQANRIGRRRIGKGLLGFAAFLVIFFGLFQIVDNPLNVVRRKGMRQSLVQRLGMFSPRVIAEGTRFRILVCSQGLVAKRPAQGHGIGSFQYVYPEEQGRYLSAHLPDSILRPVKEITGRAHNEYLSLAIELGFVGLALALWLIAAAFRRGWRGPPDAAEPPAPEERTFERLTYLPIGASTVTILVHGLTDFPLHMIFYGLLLGWMGGLWAARGAAAGGWTATAPAPAASGLMGSCRRVALLCAALAASAVAVALAPWYVRPLQNKLLVSRGMGHRNEFLRSQERLSDLDKQRLLQGAHRWHATAARLAPGDGYTNFLLAVAHQLRGDFVQQNYELARADNDTTQARDLKGLALKIYNQALEATNRAEPEWRNHNLYSVKARIHLGLWELTGRPEHNKLAKTNFETAIRYSPADGESLYLLCDLYQNDPAPDDARIRRYRGQIHEYDPEVWERIYIGTVARLVGKDDYRGALRRLVDLTDIAPRDQFILYHIVLCYAELGELEAAHALTANATNSGYMTGETRAMCDLYLALTERNWVAIVRNTERVSACFEAGAFDPASWPRQDILMLAVRLYHALGLEQLGEPKAAAALEAVRQAYARHPVAAGTFDIARALALIRFFENPDRGLALLDQQWELRQVFPIVMARVIRQLLRRGDRERAAVLFNRLQERFPHFSQLPQLKDEIQNAKPAPPAPRPK